MPIYGKDPADREPVPPEPSEGVISPADSRYHVVFSDSPDMDTQVEQLGLLLSDSGGRLAFNVQHSSPFGGMLGGGGSPTDRDLSRYTVRSQSDWRAGRGLLTSYEDTLRFHDSLADTRFPGKITLPPEPIQTGVNITAANAPENVPTAGRSSNVQQLYARWDGGRTAQSLSAFSLHASSPGTDPQNDPPTTDATYAISRSALTGTVFAAAQSILLDTTKTMTYFKFYASKDQTSSVNFRVYLYSGSGTTLGTPIASPTTSATLQTSVRTAVQVVFSPPRTLTAETQYWLVITCDVGEDALIHLTTGDQYSGGQFYESDNLSVRSPRPDQDVRFVINDGTAPVYATETRRKIARPFTMGLVDKNLTTLSLYLSSSQWGTLPTISAKVFSDSAGAPGVEKATGTIAANPGTAANWVDVSMSAFTLKAGTTYWIQLEVSGATYQNDTTITWGGSESTNTDDALTNAYSSGVYAGWSEPNPTARLYFKINGLVDGTAPHWIPYDYNVRRLVQSFTIAAGPDLNITQIRMFVQKVSWSGSPTLRMDLYTGATNPTTEVASGAAISASTFVNVIAQAGWVVFPVTYTATGGAKYWAVLTPTAPDVNDIVEIDWHGDTTDTYASGASRAGTTVNNGTEAWAAADGDRYFKVNSGSGGSTAPTVAPVRFADKWYIAAGTDVLRFNTATSEWDVVAALGQTVTSLATFNEQIFAAQGDATQIQYSPTGNSGDWYQVGGTPHYFTHLRAYNGYLYAAKATGGSGALDYFNGSVWNSEVAGAGQIITVGHPGIDITGIVGLQNDIIITAATGMYALSASLVYQIIDYSNEEYQDNGKNALTWMADGRLYVPIAQSLHAYDGSRLSPVGLDLDDGLPVAEQGHVAAMVGSRSFLFAAVDAGASGRSGVYAFNGAGWHCLVKATAPGIRIRAIGLEQVTSASSRPRLWYWEEGTPWYVEFPDLTDLPAGYTSSRYAPTGYLESCWLGGELSQIPKDFTSIIVRSTGVVAGTTQIGVWVEIDRSGILFPVGNVTQSPHQELELIAATFSPTTTAAGSTTQTINTVEEGARRISPGEFVRIGEEVGQVSSASKSSFTLVLPLEEAPAAGVTIYPARPSGREIRYRLALETFDGTQTPIVNRVSLRWGELILDKRRITMTVRIEDGMHLRGSNAQAYPYSASALRTRLREWMRRTAPFYMTDPTGDQILVKIVAANETSFAESNSAIGTMWSSRLSLTLDEV